MVEGLQEFLQKHPGIRVMPKADSSSTWLIGRIRLNHQANGFPVICEKIRLEIEITESYPHTPPIFKEIGGAFPLSADFHVNPDQSLCLGSHFRLMQKLNDSTNFNEFFDSLFIPYAYAVLLKSHHDIDMVFGELGHGDEGEIEDFGEAFGLKTREEILDCLQALSTRKRVANKKPCPCGCENRLGSCSLHLALNKYRNLPRSFYKNTYNRLSTSRSLND